MTQTQPEKSYSVAIYVGAFASVWREKGRTAGEALDAALSKRMHNNPDDPPTHFVVTPEEVGSR